MTSKKANSHTINHKCLTQFTTTKQFNHNETQIVPEWCPKIKKFTISLFLSRSNPLKVRSTPRIWGSKSSIQLKKAWASWLFIWQTTETRNFLFIKKILMVVLYQGDGLWKSEERAETESGFQGISHNADGPFRHVQKRKVSRQFNQYERMLLFLSVRYFFSYKKRNEEEWRLTEYSRSKQVQVVNPLEPEVQTGQRWTDQGVLIIEIAQVLKRKCKPEQ